MIFLEKKTSQDQIFHTITTFHQLSHQFLQVKEVPGTELSEDSHK